MPLLGGLIVSLFGSTFSLLALYFTKKVAFAMSAMVLMSASTLALFVAMRLALTGLNDFVHGAPLVFMQAVQMMIPPAAPFCISTYVTIWSATLIYSWRKDLMSVALKA